MAIRKVIKKKLTPKGRRVDSAVLRLAKVSATAAAKKRAAGAEKAKGLASRTAEYDRRVARARYEAGYGPGDSIERSVGGVDPYSGSSYRVGRGTPKVAEGTNALRPTNKEQYEVASLRGSQSTGMREIRGTVNRRLGRTQAAKPKSTVKRAIKGGAIAALAAAILAEINKKKD